MGKYGLIKVDDLKTVPMDALIADLRFKGGATHGYYGYSPSFSGLSKTALEGLADADIVLVSDLQGQSQTTLVAFRGVGPETAKKLIKAAKKASVRYRGVGFPYEVEIAVYVPDRAVEYLRDLGSKDSKELIAEHISAVFFESIEENVITAKRSKLQKQIDQRQDQISVLKGELKGLEA